jgi:hypothetical protein
MPEFFLIFDPGTTRIYFRKSFLLTYGNQLFYIGKFELSS